jgi:hypothetical protein
MLDRADLIRNLAAMTDDEYDAVTTEARGEPDTGMRQFARQVFGRKDADTIDLSHPEPKGRNVIAREGENPDSGGFTAEDIARDWVRRFFDPKYAATNPPLTSE